MSELDVDMYFHIRTTIFQEKIRYHTQVHHSYSRIIPFTRDTINEAEVLH